MRAVAAEVGQQLGRAAPGIFERVSQDRQSVEGAVGVDALGESDGGRGPPGKFEGDGAERVAEDLAEDR